MVAVSAAVWGTQDGVRYVVVPPRLAIVGTPVAGQPGAFVPTTAAQARAMIADELAVIDGPMFATCGNHLDYARLDCARPDYRLLDTARGVDVPGRYPTRGGTISIMPDGRVAVGDGATTAPGAAFAMQGYPALVRRGANVASNAAGTNGEQNWRAGLGVRRDGSIVFAVGRKDMQAFADAFRALDCADAFYTDGGGSGREEGADGSVFGSPENRRVPVWIAAVTSSPNPVRDTAVMIVKGLALAGAAALAVIFVRRETDR